MKRNLKIGMPLWCLIMILGAIGLEGCGNEDEYPEGGKYKISSTKYMFKYESTITILQEIYPVKGDPDYLYEGDYYSKKYLTNFGDTLRIKPHISIYVKNDEDIDEVVKQFGDKLSFNKKVGWVFVYDCYVSNSDEVLKITTQLTKDKNVIACDAFTDTKVELLDM